MRSIPAAEAKQRFVDRDTHGRHRERSVAIRESEAVHWFASPAARKDDRTYVAHSRESCLASSSSLWLMRQIFNILPKRLY